MKPIWDNTPEDKERKAKFKSACALTKKTMSKRCEELIDEDISFVDEFLTQKEKEV